MRALRRQGGVTLRSDFMRDLGKLGVYMNGAGILRSTDGLAIVTISQAHRIAQEIAMLAEKVPKDGTTRRKKQATPEMVDMISHLAKAHSLIMGKITETIALVRGRQFKATGGPGTSENKNAPRVPSFPEGAKIEPPQTMIVAQHVHVDGAGAPDSVPPP